MSRLRGRADRLRDAGQWSSAAALYGAYLERQPRDAAIWVQRGNCLKEAGDLQASLTSYRRAEQLGPQDSDVQLQLGHLSKVLGDSRSAQARYRRALELDPDNENARYEVEGFAPTPEAVSRAETWSSQEESDWGRDELAGDGSAVAPRGLVGPPIADAGPEPSADEVMARLAADPADASAWAVLERLLGGAPDALAVRRAVSQAPDIIDLHLNLAPLLIRCGMSAAAREALRRAFRLEPRLEIARELRGLGAPRSYIPRIARPQPRPPGVFLDITDLLDVLTHRATVTGIQRVQCSLAAQILAMEATHDGGVLPDFVIWHDRELWRLGAAALTELLTHFERFGPTQVDKRRALIQRAHDHALRVQPQPGDTVVATGVAYLTPDLVVCGQALRKIGVRLGAILHDFIPLTHPELVDPKLTYEFSTAISKVMLQLDFALPNSEFTAAEAVRLRQEGGYRPIPIRPVPLAHTTRPEDAATPRRVWRGEIASLKGVDYVLCVGTFATHKNQDLLFQAWRLMIARGVEPPLLVLVGHRAHGADSLFRQMEATRFLDGRIRVLEHLDDDQVETLYNACLFTVFPSKVEGWGLPLGESLAHGKVAVASNVASLPEVGGPFAVYIDPYNVSGAADAIAGLLADREHLRFLERRIRSHFKRRTWRDYADNLLRAIGELTGPAAAEPVVREGAVALKPGQVLKVRSPAYDWEFGPRLPPREAQEGEVLRELLLIDGWHGRETWGVWASRPKARINVNTSLPAGARVEVSLQLRAAAWAHDNQIVIRSTCGASTTAPLPPMWAGEAARAVPRNFVVVLGCAVDRTGAIDLTIEMLGAPAPAWWGEPRTLVVGLVRLLYVAADAAAVGLRPNQLCGPGADWADPRPRMVACSGAALGQALRGVQLVGGWRHGDGGQAFLAGREAQLAFIVTAKPATPLRIVVPMLRRGGAEAMAITLSSGTDENTFELAAGAPQIDLWVDCLAPADGCISLTLSAQTMAGGQPHGLMLGGVAYGPRRTQGERLALLEAVRYPQPSSAGGLRDLQRQLMGFVIVGHIKGSYSLAQLNRRLAIALEDLRPGSVAVEQIEGRPMLDLADVPPAERAKLTELARRPPHDEGPIVSISQHWPFWSQHAESDLSLAFVHWEEGLLPRALRVQLNNDFDAILAPTRFVAKALTDSGVSRPVVVVGDGPDLDPMLEAGAERMAGLQSRREGMRPFTFLHVSSCFPRKGVDALLRAYASAFRKPDPVRLLIKGFPNPHNDVDQQIAALRERDPDAPEIVFVNQDLPREDVLELMAEADVMVLPSRGEGFNLPAVEGLAVGLPVIATGFGGHVDFLDGEVGRLVDYDFAQSLSHVASPGSTWVDPDPVDLAEALREAYEQAGDDAAAARRAGWDRARAIGDDRAWAERVREAVLDLLAMPALRPPKVAWVSSWAVRCGIAEYSSMLLEHYPGTKSDLTVLCDIRTSPERVDDGPQTRAVWEVWRSASIERLAQEIDLTGAEAVVIQHQPGLITWPDLLALLRHPAIARRQLVMQLHTVNELPSGETETGAALIEALRGVQRLLVHTVRDLNALKAFGLVENVALFPHGVTAPSEAPPEPRRIGSRKPPLIGSYGFFLPPKGISQLIEALAILRRRWAGARLRLVNAAFPHLVSAEEIARCQTLARRLGVFDAIEWQTEFLENAESHRLLRECDIVVLPYQATKESASGAVRVALASGAPVAVTPIPIFDDVRAAVHMLDGGDAEAIAAGVGALLADPQARREVQARAQAWAGHYAWPLMSERLAGMIAGLVATSAVPRGAFRLPDTRSPAATAAARPEPANGARQPGRAASEAFARSPDAVVGASSPERT